MLGVGPPKISNTLCSRSARFRAGQNLLANQRNGSIIKTLECILPHAGERYAFRHGDGLAAHAGELVAISQGNLDGVEHAFESREVILVMKNLVQKREKFTMMARIARVCGADGKLCAVGYGG